MRRVFLSAFGDPGHAFPSIALALKLDAMGHSVALETAEPWRSAVANSGVEFFPAPEFPAVGDRQAPLSPYAAVAAAMETTRPRITEFAPDVLAHDILTLAPALSAELEGIPTATVIPHVSPVTPKGVPPYGLGASTPRTPFGNLLWWGLSKPIGFGLDRGAREYNELRRGVGLGPRLGHHSALSQQLIIVATLPQLERGEPFDERFHVTGPIFWEPECPDVDLPEGDGPLVMVAPSTAQDPDHSLLRASLEGLGGLDARIISTWNRRPIHSPPPVPDNTKLVEWLSYSRTMPKCDVVVSQGGHGTIARTLQAGAVPVVIPFAGDQYENAARVDSAGLGIRLPARLMSPKTLRLAVERALDSSSMREGCQQTAAWAAAHDGTATAAELILNL